MWTSGRPHTEGWYFWRKRRNTNDPWKWDAIYVMKDSSRGMGGGYSFWIGGTDCWEPRGGWWMPIPSADERQKTPLADRLDERGFTKREDRACGSPYCDKRFSPRDATQAYCSVACEPPGPPSPPAGFSPRWGDDTEQPKLPNNSADPEQGSK